MTDNTTSSIDGLKSLLQSGQIQGQIIEESQEATSGLNLGIDDVDSQEYADAYDKELSSEFNCPVYTITKRDIPSGLFSVTFKEPIFQDRREATRSYPKSKVGYSLEELLLANCIISINFIRVDQDADYKLQPINKLTTLSASDNAYLLSVFLSTATISSEMAAQIQNKTDKVLKDPKFQGVYTIPKEEMPTQSFSVTFVEPVGRDRYDVERTYPGASDRQCGYTVEEMLFAKSVSLIDGVEPPKHKELINLLSEWSHIDVQYAISTFTAIFSLSEEKADESRLLGKSFLQKRRNLT